MVIPIESTYDEGNLDLANVVNYVNDDDCIYAMDDRVFTMSKEYMVDMKGGSILSDKLQGIVNERSSPQEIVVIIEGRRHMLAEIYK
jgi:hypothetical protein